MAIASKPEVVFGDKIYIDCVIYVADQANKGDWKFTLSKDVATGEFYRTEEFGETDECFDETSLAVPDEIEAAYKLVENEARAAIEAYEAGREGRVVAEMVLYGVSANTDEGSRFFVIQAESAEQALDNVNDQTGCPKENIQVFKFEDLLGDQYGGFAELTTV